MDKKKQKTVSVCCEVWYDMVIEIDSELSDDELKEQLEEYCELADILEEYDTDPWEPIQDRNVTKAYVCN